MTNLRELRHDADVDALVSLGRANCLECTPKLPFDPECVRQNASVTLKDHVRDRRNVWIVWNDEKPIAYAVGSCGKFYFCDAVSASLQLLYVLPEYRGGWSTIKLVKAFEQWARDNKAVRFQTGVERVDDVDAAKRIRKMFPKLGYKWAGSSYIKEI